VQNNQQINKLKKKMQVIYNQQLNKLPLYLLNLLFKNKNKIQLMQVLDLLNKLYNKCKIELIHN